MTRDNNSDEFKLDSFNDISDYDYIKVTTENTKVADLLIRERKWFHAQTGSISIADMENHHLVNTLEWIKRNKSSLYRWSDHLFNMQREVNRRLKEIKRRS